jgi:hypothetical protein
LKSDNDELIDKKIDDVADFYDEINAEELKQEIRTLRRFIYYCPSRTITVRNLH